MKDRLRKLCAATLNVSTENLEGATPDSIKQWDSINPINLIAAIESEFNIDFEPEDIVASLESYAKLESMVATALT